MLGLFFSSRARLNPPPLTSVRKGPPPLLNSSSLFFLSFRKRAATRMDAAGRWCVAFWAFTISRLLTLSLEPYSSLYIPSCVCVCVCVYVPNRIITSLFLLSFLSVCLTHKNQRERERDTSISSRCVLHPEFRGGGLFALDHVLHEKRRRAEGSRPRVASIVVRLCEQQVFKSDHPIDLYLVQ